MFKKILIIVSLCCGLSMMSTYSAPPHVPSFEADFADHLTNPSDNNNENTTERVYDREIDPDRSLEDNLKELFYPSVGGVGGTIWSYVRTIGVAIFFIFLVWIGIQFMMNADDESKLADARKHILRLLYGAFLYFGAVRILGVALQLTTPGGSTSLVNNFQNNLRFQLLAFFKALAFFAAIVAMLIAGYRMMHAMGREEQLKAARTGIINVLIALVLLKVVDFIYLLAMDTTFFDQAETLIIRIARIMGYIVGVVMLGSIFVAGYNYITDGGSGEGAKRAGRIIQTVFIAGLTIFLFLLIMYQLIAQFT